MFGKTKVEDKKLIFLKKSVILYFILLILFFSLFFVVHAIAMTLITIPGEVEVCKDVVLLNDIASIQGDNPEIISRVKRVELVHSPKPGEVKTIDKNYIILRLKKEGVDRKNFEIRGDDKVTLRRASKKLSKHHLEEVVRERLCRYLGMKSDEMVIENLQGLEDTIIPAGDVDYSGSQWTDGGARGRRGRWGDKVRGRWGEKKRAYPLAVRGGWMGEGRGWSLSNAGSVVESEILCMR